MPDNLEKVVSSSSGGGADSGHSDISLTMNCPFYGHGLFMAHHVVANQPPFVLFNSEGNQCGLIVTSHSPCQMEIDGVKPDWRTCILVKQARCEGVV